MIYLPPNLCSVVPLTVLHMSERGGHNCWYMNCHYLLNYYWPYPYASYVKITYNKTWPYPDSHYSLISFSILITWMFTIIAPSIQLSIHIYMTIHSQHIVVAPPTVRVNCAKLQNIMDYWFAVLNVQTNSREERRNTIIIVVWSVAWQRYQYYPCCMTKKKEMLL